MTNPVLERASIRRVLVVGSWAKEQITIENIKSDPGVRVYAYMDAKNPGILALADGYRLGSLEDTDAALEYALDREIDLAIITTAGPLSSGLVDALEKEGITAFGPGKTAAKLESDKAFTRNLLKKYLSGVNPGYGVFDTPRDAARYAEDLDWRVAVKPVGLSNGLGVKVSGDQLEGKDGVIEYIEEILHAGRENGSQVIVEEKLQGEEFTLQCFVSGDLIVPTPAVQDFKKLLVGGKGPNTASMGSYSDAGWLLPFMEQSDYDQALDVIRKTVAAFQAETATKCEGFLYGQFMLTEDGLKLIEYNFRPGDPEWMNTVGVIKDNLLDVIAGLLNGVKRAPEFEKLATVCQYIVPPGYPLRANQVLDVSLDEEGIRKAGAKAYYSCGLDAGGRLNVGVERGIAFLAKGRTTAEAHAKIREALSHVQGDFHHRDDIGSDGLIKRVVETVERLRK